MSSKACCPNPSVKAKRIRRKQRKLRVTLRTTHRKPNKITCKVDDPSSAIGELILYHDDRHQSELSPSNHYFPHDHLEITGFRSESSPNSPIVRATRSTFSRKPFVVSLASRTVEVANDLRHLLSIRSRPLVNTYATRSLPSTVKVRLTASL